MMVQWLVPFSDVSTAVFLVYAGAASSTSSGEWIVTAEEMSAKEKQLLSGE